MDINEHIRCQKNAISVWLRSVRHAVRQPSEPDEVSDAAVRARHQWCELIAAGLNNLIDGQKEEADALIYALITLTQVYGIHVALEQRPDGDSFKEILRAGSVMIEAFQRVKRDIDANLPVVEAVH